MFLFGTRGGRVTEVPLRAGAERREGARYRAAHLRPLEAVPGRFFAKKIPENRHFRVEERTCVRYSYTVVVPLPRLAGFRRLEERAGARRIAGDGEEPRG